MTTVREEYLNRGFEASDLDTAEPLFPAEDHDAQRFGDYTAIAAVRRGGYTFILGVYDPEHATAEPLLFGPELGNVSIADGVTPAAFEQWLDTQYPG